MTNKPIVENIILTKKSKSAVEGMEIKFIAKFALQNN